MFKSTEIWLLLKKCALMAVCNWVVCNRACCCTATVWAIIQAPRHRVWSLRLDWWSGARWCCQRVPGHRSGCRDWEIGTRDGGLGGGWGHHAPLDWNSYCVHELAHNTLLFLFVFVFDLQVLEHRGCHVLPCMSRNTGQINPAGFQSLKCMYYIHVIMIIKWFWLWLWLWLWQYSYGQMHLIGIPLRDLSKWIHKY